MCRLLGMISDHATGLSFSLVDGPNSLQRQSHQHPDGWGIACWQGAGWQCVRSPRPAHEDASFGDQARRLTGLAFVAHIRKASRGPLTTANTHPFLFGGWAFAHNGTFTNMQELARGIDEGLRPEGQTDSEALFRLLLTRLGRRAGGCPQASTARVCRCLREVLAQAQDSQGTGLLLSDGRRLFGYRRGKPLMLLREQANGVTRLQVSSEAVAPEDGWRQLPDGHGFIIDGALTLRDWDEVLDGRGP